MPTLTIETVNASVSTLESTISVPPSLRRFFTEEKFQATYDHDISSVEESILAIPVVGQVAPVAWANGVDMSVPTLDRAYMDCLETVRSRLQSMYPEFMEGGEIHVDNPVDNTVPTEGDAGLLFSGGVDSMTSYARHSEEAPTLIGMCGWTVDVEDREEWQQLEARMRSFASQQGTDAAIISSNVLSMLDTRMLFAHYKRYLVGSWYSGVGHGLGLLSLCAPLSVSKGLGHIYIASTHTAAFDHPWGSHPEIDNHVRWGTATTSHDGFELSRQEKIERLVEFIQREAPNLTLYTCNKGESTNCNNCEKCFRTAVGLLLADVKPSAHGYAISPEDLQYARERLEDGDWIIDEDTLFMWKDLQAHAGAGTEHDSPVARTFFSWLAEADLQACFKGGRIISDNRRGRVIRTLTRQTPYPLYAAIYPVFDRVRNVI